MVREAHLPPACPRPFQAKLETCMLTKASMLQIDRQSGIVSPSESEG